MNEYIPLVETYELVFDFGTTYMKLEPPVYVLNGPVVTKMYDTDSDDELQAAADRLLAQPAEGGWIKPTEALLAAKEQSPFFWPSAGAGKLSVADEDGWLKPNKFLLQAKALPSIKDGGVIVEVPGKATLVNAVITGSLSGDEDDVDMEEASVPFTLVDLKAKTPYALRQECFKYKLATGKIQYCKWTKKECIEALKNKFGLKEVPFTFTAEEIRKMNQTKLRAHCVTYGLKRDTVPKMKEALMNKFGLEGSTLSDYQQKLEETNKAMAAFLKLANVLAITSKIRNFNPKNRAHAERFMEQYREQNGKGTIRSRKST